MFPDLPPTAKSGSQRTVPATGRNPSYQPQPSQHAPLERTVSENQFTHFERVKIEMPPGSLFSLELESEGLMKLRDRQRAEYEEKIAILRRQILDNNQRIAEYKAKIMYYEGK
jgi:hypothetical protein